MNRPPTAPADASPRCPRCGAPLGRLSAGAPTTDDALYCGCCGLVLPPRPAAATESR